MRKDQQNCLAAFARHVQEGSFDEALLCLSNLGRLSAYTIPLGDQQISLLGYAVMHGAETVVDALLARPEIDRNIGVFYRGHSPLMMACRNGSDALLEKLIKARASLSFRAVDGQTVFTQIQRVSSFDILEAAAREQDCLDLLFQPQVLQDFCRQNLDDLAQYFVQRMEEEKWHFARDFSLMAKNLSGNAKPSMKALGEQLQQILDGMAAAMHETLTVLDDKDFCLSSLRDLDRKFQAFYLAEYGSAFPCLDRSTISIEERGALVYPVPKASYQPVKKHSALPRFLLGFLQKRGLIATLDEVSYSDGQESREKNYCALENSKEFGPFHGKFSRLLQVALLVLAHEAGRVQLPENLMLKQFIEIFFASEASPALQEQATFRDPYYLNSYVMNEGYQNAPSLSDYMVASFCKQLKQVYERVYAGQDEKPSLAKFCADTSLVLAHADFVSRNPNQTRLFQGRKIYQRSDFFDREEAAPARAARICVIS